MPETDASLDNRLRELARAAVLLVGCDFDGTLAPLVDDPARALGNPDSLRALRLMAGLPHTHVAVVSGRSLRDLALLSRLPSEVHLVGSHGSEFDVGISIDIDEAARDRLADISRELDKLAQHHDGIGLEVKPASVALHYRTADRETASAVVDAVLKGPATREGVYVKHGKMVVELAVVHANKGDSLRRLRQELGASAVLFFGDDVTDEDAFATLSGPDLGIKVGEGTTHASLRLADTDQVANARQALRSAARLGAGHRCASHRAAFAAVERQAHGHRQSSRAHRVVVLPPPRFAGAVRRTGRRRARRLFRRRVGAQRGTTRAALRRRLDDRADALARLHRARLLRRPAGRARRPERAPAAVALVVGQRGRARHLRPAARLFDGPREHDHRARRTRCIYRSRRVRIFAAHRLARSGCRMDPA